ncbi:uncharacterized protein F4822DRAFT_428233 [Hypoxylon trugodes]|uniref:uncharacterized protein n=1 Tax=Hypoxylon trugodes TaxID=326681 RepID=UPI0021923F6C|nr:uncharacterized protein F4822DRAFT_428233 [Hypoxylon trugodes]KAI1389892.1 hypothetical protein F4822DRAFT_428233 [Hypoxylon trugodes]
MSVSSSPSTHNSPVPYSPVIEPPPGHVPQMPRTSRVFGDFDLPENLMHLLAEADDWVPQEWVSFEAFPADMWDTANHDPAVIELDCERWYDYIRELRDRYGLHILRQRPYRPLIADSMRRARPGRQMQNMIQSYLYFFPNAVYGDIKLGVRPLVYTAIEEGHLHAFRIFTDPTGEAYTSNIQEQGDSLMRWSVERSPDSRIIVWLITQGVPFSMSLRDTLERRGMAPRGSTFSNWLTEVIAHGYHAI